MYTHIYTHTNTHTSTHTHTYAQHTSTHTMYTHKYAAIHKNGREGLVFRILGRVGNLVIKRLHLNNLKDRGNVICEPSKPNATTGPCDMTLSKMSLK